MFWGLSAGGFLFFSFDELLQFHERLGEFIASTPIGPAEIFRNWNDVIVIGYGMIAILVLFYCLPAILRIPMVAETLALAFGFYLTHTIIDSTQVRTSLSIIVEESAKLFSSAFLALAMLYGIFATVATLKNSKA